MKIPALVIHGRDDLSVSAEEGRLLASIIPRAQLVLLPTGMHYFPTDSEVAQRRPERLLDSYRRTIVMTDEPSDF